MDANAVLWEELRQRHIVQIDDLEPEAIVELALRYAVWLPLDTYIRSPWLAPFAVRKIRVRTDVHAAGAKRDLWGLPDPHGYFTDDNSLIKGVANKRSVSPASSPYGTGPISKGFVCCHVWPGTTGDPLLFSFVANLVWLPASLARYSDVHPSGSAHLVHDTLKALAIRRYRTAKPEVAAGRVDAAWAALNTQIEPLIVEPVANEFIVGDRVVRLVKRRLNRLTQFLEATLDDQTALPARFSRRYHAGTGKHIDTSVLPIQQFVSAQARIQLLNDMRACKPLPR